MTSDQQSTLRWHRRAVGTVGLLLLLLWVAIPVRPLGATPPTREQAVDFEALDRFLEQEMAATRLPGLAVAVVSRDETLHLRGFGIADPTGRPVTPRTLFTIGSTGKSMTALAIMQLVEAGQIDLDRPVQEYIPTFAVGGSPDATRITARHLLTHSSGISTTTGLAFVGRRNEGPDARAERLLALQQAPLAARPGERFEYSNANYLWLGYIVEGVSGQSYETYMREHIFDPLAMPSASLSLQEAKARGLAAGHRYWFGRPVAYEMPYHQGEGPAASFTPARQRWRTMSARI